MGNCRSLKSVKDLNGLKKLKKIEFNVCSKIEDYHFLTDLPNLECLEFIDCRDIKTIKFIKNFPKLRELALLGNTNVLDSDMRPAKDIEDLCYAPRKHYNIKIETPKYDELRKQNLKKLRM